MSNLTECAFPAQETPQSNSSFSPGFTKHEYAAILIAHGLLSNYEFLTTIQEGDDIATTAHFMATQVLGKFK